MNTTDFLQALYSRADGTPQDGYAVSMRMSGRLQNIGVYAMPGELPRMADDLLSYADAHDTYVSVYTFDRPRRLAPYSLPSPWLYIEVDEPSQAWRGVEPTMRIESSPGREHLYWRCDRDIEGDERRRLLKALHSQGEGDDAAKDNSRVLRAPGTWSHKRGTPVRYVGGSGEVYSVAEVIDDRNVPGPTRGRGRPKVDRTDLEAYLRANGVEYEPMSDELGVKFAVSCPWSDGHTVEGDTAYVGKIEGGGLWFNCYHSHCSRRAWSDFKAYHFQDFMTPKRLHVGGVEIGR